MFGKEFRKMDRKKLELLILLKDEFENIDNKIKNMNQRLKSVEEKTDKILEILVKNLNKNFISDALEFIKSCPKIILLIFILIIVFCFIFFFGIYN